MRSQQRLSKLLLRQGIVYYGGRSWTRPREVWLCGKLFTVPGLQQAYDTAFTEHDAGRKRRRRRKVLAQPEAQG